MATMARVGGASIEFEGTEPRVMVHATNSVPEIRLSHQGFLD